jgi:PAS domain S-box-containing protein
MTESHLKAGEMIEVPSRLPPSEELARLKDVLRHTPIVLLAVEESGVFSLAEGGGIASWQTGTIPRVGMSMYDLVEDSAELVDGLEKALHGQDQRCRTYVGDRVFELTFSPGAKDGSPTIRACCMAKDITERAESEKQRIQEQLAAFEQHRRMAEDFRALIERLPLGIVVVCDGRVVFANLAASAAFHWSDPNAYVGRDFAQFLPPEKRALLRVEPDKRFQLVRFGELQLSTSDAASFTAEVQAVGIEYEGLPASLFAIRDVTELHRMEQDLRQAQRLEAIGRLAAGIAHEINTPIQFVGDNASFFERSCHDVMSYVAFCEEQLRQFAGEQYSAVVARREELDIPFVQEEGPKAASNIMEGVVRVAKIVSAMKEYAHPGGTEKALADLNHAIETTVVVATNEWKHVAKLVTQLGTLPPVPCHLGDLNQVFLNLLVNAAHAIGDKVGHSGATGQITIRTYLQNDMAVVEIADDGAGIPHEIRGRVFDPFFTTKEVGRGTGQGLTLARRVVVEKHEGQLDFTSEVGKGTTFFVRLPLHAEAKSAP